MSDRFELIIFDTYGVLLLRSPRYLEEELIEEVDALSRDLVHDDWLWSALRKRPHMNDKDIAALHERLAAKFCKNLNVWQHLPQLSAQSRLMLLHAGPPGLLERWRRDHDLERYFSMAASTVALGVGHGEPALYRRIAEDAGVDPRRCLLVNDERAPVDAAREAGMGAYRFGTAHGMRSAVAEPRSVFQ